MKYKSEKSLRRAKKAFSLIELMIVIVIIGALTAIILPQFDVSEAEAKDTGCDASNYGTLSQLTKFRSLNGAYPARMHTGYEAAKGGASTEELMGTSEDSVFAKIPSFTALNMASGASSTARSTSFNVNNAAYRDFGDSLREAGIISLACGGFPIEAANSNIAYVAFNGIAGNTSMTTAKAVYLSAITSDWFEAWAINDDGTANDAELDITSTPITINGIPLPYYMFEDPRTEYEDGTALPTSITSAAMIGGESGDGIVVPLFLAPTTDWDHWYDANGGENDSKIQVAQVGQCPWLEGGAEFRYYIGIFKLYADGSKAKLLGTMCPEGGSLNP